MESITQIVKSNRHKEEEEVLYRQIDKHVSQLFV